MNRSSGCVLLIYRYLFPSSSLPHSFLPSFLSLFSPPYWLFLPGSLLFSLLFSLLCNEVPAATMARKKCVTTATATTITTAAYSGCKYRRATRARLANRKFKSYLEKCVFLSDAHTSISQTHTHSHTHVHKFSQTFFQFFDAKLN